MKYKLYHAAYKGDLAAIRRGCQFQAEFINGIEEDMLPLGVILHYDGIKRLTPTDKQRDRAFTALHAAFLGNINLEVVEYLFSKGADPADPENYKVPIHYLPLVVKNKHAPKTILAGCIILLADAGGDTNTQETITLVNDYKLNRSTEFGPSALAPEIIGALFLAAVIRGHEDFFTDIHKDHLTVLTPEFITTYLARINTKDYQPIAKNMFNLLVKLKLIDKEKCAQLISAFENAGKDNQVSQKLLAIEDKAAVLSVVDAEQARVKVEAPKMSSSTAVILAGTAAISSSTASTTSRPVGTNKTPFQDAFEKLENKIDGLFGDLSARITAVEQQLPSTLDNRSTVNTMK